MVKETLIDVQQKGIRAKNIVELFQCISFPGSHVSYKTFELLLLIVIEPYIGIRKSDSHFAFGKQGVIERNTFAK
ncbi:hypothetical protein [Phnomibacter ginsenosidimutans]|uniref:hypothetical protein n=1 Tax=Phnomibacter ginsenosidimutans TaxID=2676868 RepID=UPI001FE8A533|nr:hypothetical protein [Phnomibacter ginsenosidimutans]